MPELATASHISAWCDAGPHFRSYEHLAYLQQQWFEKLNCTLRLCYFVAKHGKGIVDTVFATVNRWILEALPLPNSRISTSVELVKACEKGDEFPI